MVKKLIVTILVVAALLMGIVGIVAAQDPTPPADVPCAGAGVCPGNTGAGSQYRGTQGAERGARGTERGAQDAAHGGMGQGGTMPALLAEALDMTVADLSAALDAGQTIAELAEAQGLSMTDVVAVLVAPHVEWLNQAVESGTLTRELADEQIATMEEHMLERLKDGFAFGAGTRGQGSADCPMGGGAYGGYGRGGMRGGGNRYQVPAQPGVTP